MNVSQYANTFEAYANSERSEMLKFVPTTAARILDVGCSVGNFGSLLKKERNAEVWGVEIDPQASSIAAGKLDRVICGEFSSALPLPRRSFDCVVFNDVLEHMVDPVPAIRHAAELVRESGQVIASIPNVRYFRNIWKLLIERNWQYEETGVLDRTHLRFFTKRSIRALFSDSSFEVETLAGINAVDYYDTEYRNWFRVLNRALFNTIEDMRWQQFAVVARPIPESSKE